MRGFTIVDEPAVESYFYLKGRWFSELKATCVETWKSNLADSKKCNQKLYQNNREAEKKKILYVKSLFLMMVSCSVFVGTFVWTPILSVVAFTVAIALAITYNLIAAVLLSGEVLFLKIHGLFKLCPHCHERESLPVYECPKCHAKHTRLIPGPRYGIFFRRCSTFGCREKIPVLRICGKSKLPAFCRKCNRPLENCDYVPATLAILGGRSVGKSTILGIVATKIQDTAKNRGFTTTVNSDSETKSIAMKNNMANGIFPKATQNGAIDAFCLDINCTPYPCRLYIYDPAGEVMDSTDSLKVHRYNGYLKSIIWVLDPFSLDSVRLQLEDKTEMLTAATASEVSPLDCLQRWLLSIESNYNGILKDSVCAVAINKTDVPGFAREFNLKPGDGDEECRKFLSNNDYQAFINLLDAKFPKDHLRFFAVSASGNRTSGAFEPIGFDNIIDWLWPHTIKDGDAIKTEAAKEA